MWTEFVKESLRVWIEWIRSPNKCDSETLLPFPVRKETWGSSCGDSIKSSAGVDAYDIFNELAFLDYSGHNRVDTILTCTVVIPMHWRNLDWQMFPWEVLGLEMKTLAWKIWIGQYGPVLHTLDKYQNQITMSMSSRNVTIWKVGSQAARLGLSKRGSDCSSQCRQCIHRWTRQFHNASLLGTSKGPVGEMWNLSGPSSLLEESSLSGFLVRPMQPWPWGGRHCWMCSCYTNFPIGLLCHFHGQDWVEAKDKGPRVSRVPWEWDQKRANSAER